MRKHRDFDYGEHVIHSDDGEGNWLVSYADLMTLLFGFFAILVAFSSPDASKMEKVKESTAQSMGGEYSNPFNELSAELTDLFKELNVEDNIAIENLSDGIRMTFSSKVIFASASSKLNVEAKALLEKVSEVLLKQKKQYLIIVEGHTDDLGISTREYRSNWDLSLARASEVVHLFETLGLDHDILRPVGLADVEPQVKIDQLNSDDLSRAREQNRRIVIRLIKQKH